MKIEDYHGNNIRTSNNSKDIIFWNVYSQYGEDAELLKIAIIGIHRETMDNNLWQLLEIEMLTEDDYINLKHILDNKAILKDNFVNKERGISFDYPIIDSNTTKDDKYWFALVIKK